MREIFSGNSGMTKKYKVKITASAQKDIEYIWDYISQSNPVNAVEFINQIEQKIKGLCELPDRHPLIPESHYIKTHEYRHLIYKQYRIVYRRNEETVFISRIFNGAQLLDIASL